MCGNTSTIMTILPSLMLPGNKLHLIPTIHTHHCHLCLICTTSFLCSQHKLSPFTQRVAFGVASTTPPQYNTASKVKAFSNNNPFQNMACSSDSLSSLVRKRFLDSDGNKSGDRRNKRMMKNRESAARSRARKQAYTLELQQRLKQLLEENARLKSQHEQLRETAAIQQKRKHNRYRASSAPF